MDEGFGVASTGGFGPQLRQLCAQARVLGYVDVGGQTGRHDEGECVYAKTIRMNLSKVPEHHTKGT